MKFKINGTNWEIVELTEEEISKQHGDENEYMYGFCSYINNKIYLNKQLCFDRKKNVLIHELSHCWTMSNGWGFGEDVSREELCNIIACSNEFINKIVNKYFK